jgi:NADH-quinone oxidoreductase subunit M
MNMVLLLLLPLGGALASVVFRASDRAVRVVAATATLATAVAAGALWVAYADAAQPLSWQASGTGPGSFLILHLDGLAMPLIALTAVLAAVAVVSSWDVERVGFHMALLLALEAAVMAVFLAGDLVLFYVAWEAVLIPMFFLIGGWGHENRRYAAMKFFIYTFAGSALMLVGIVALVLAAGGSTALGGSAAALSEKGQRLVFWLLAAGFLVKIPAWPLHTWLPDAHVEAPTAGSIMLAGVLLKMGAYGFIRLCMPYTPDAFVAYAPVLAALGVIGIVYGAAMALAQRDLKRLVAYSSVSHMGFVLLAISTGTALGLTGAMLGMVSHGIVSALLFFLVGALYDRSHTREIDAFGGLGTVMPRWSTVFTVAALASLGLPGLSGFPGELLSVVEAFSGFGWWIAAAGIGVVLAGAYNLRAVRQVAQGEARFAGALGDLVPREILAVAPLLILTVALGVWPRLVTDLAESTLSAFAALLKAVN